MKFNVNRFISYSAKEDNSSNARPGYYFYRPSHFQLLALSLGTTMLVVTSLTSCKKFVDVGPPVTSVTSNNIYTTDATAASVLTGVYTNLSASRMVRGGTINSISLVSGLSADELSLYGGISNSNQLLVEFYLNRLEPGLSTQSSTSIWNDFFSKLYIVNLALERLNVSKDLTPSVRSQLMGEAKFLRAFFYFYMVNLYGDVPLITSSDYRVNVGLSRTASTQIYEQIINDLKDAQNLLETGYKASDAFTNTTERVRPNKWAATALLSRAYLFHGDWLNAEAQASAIINNSSVYDTVSLNKVFLKNSKESIWQLQPVNTGWNTEDARVFILPSSGPTSTSSVDGYPVFLSTQLLNAFENGDQRKVNWIGNITIPALPGVPTFYFPYKYTSATNNSPVTEYTTVLRLSEQYLIRAEASTRLGKIGEAQSDLNLIRRRAGLAPLAFNDNTLLLNSILHEKQVELFTEWGHRWLDLKRTQAINAVMAAVSQSKGTVWNSNWQWYPIPLYDIKQNPNLIQNNGY